MTKDVLLICLSTVALIYSFPYQTGWPQEIEGGVDFSSPVLVDVNGDDTLEILVAGNTRWVYLFNYNGQAMPGWPKYTTDVPTGAQETSSPSVADIDNDDAMEVVYASDVGKLFAWEIDGSDVNGFPVDLGDNIIRACATLEDVDGDDTLDICIGTGNTQHRFFVFRYDGALLFSKNVEYRIHSTAAVGDIDKDGGMEIIHGVDRVVEYGVYAWESNGDTCSGWPQQTGHHVDGSPALADIDNDSTYEVFVGSIDNKVYGWDYLGNILPSWPNVVGSGVYEGVVSSPAIGDIDNDSVLEVVIGRGIIQSGHGAVFAFSAAGDTLPGFPVNIATGSVTSSPALADIDGDAEIEIIVGCQDGNLYSYNPDASTVAGFPIFVCSSITSSPAIADIDLDGDIELVIGGKGSGNDSLYIWDLSVEHNIQRMPWPMFHHDPRHTGRFPLGLQTSVNEHDSKKIKTYTIVPTITTGNIAFSPQPEIPLEIKIFDALGRKVGNYGLSLEGFKNGVYFIQLSSPDGAIKGMSKVILVRPSNR